MTLANVQNNQIKIGKFSAKEAYEITRNKICVDLIVPYVIRIKVNNENLYIKVVIMIDYVKGWFEIT